jgi:hypothetical protein
MLTILAGNAYTAANWAADHVPQARSAYAAMSKEQMNFAVAEAKEVSPPSPPTGSSPNKGGHSR